MQHSHSRAQCIHNCAVALSPGAGIPVVELSACCKSPSVEIGAAVAAGRMLFIAWGLLTGLGLKICSEVAGRTHEARCTQVCGSVNPKTVMLSQLERFTPVEGRTQRHDLRMRTDQCCLDTQSSVLQAFHFDQVTLCRRFRVGPTDKSPGSPIVPPVQRL